MHLGNLERDKPLVDRFYGQLPVSLLEPLPDFAEACRSVLIVNAVIGNAVDEEEGKHFDALALKGALFLEMLFDSLEDLRLHDVVTEPARFLPQLQKEALIEFDIFRARRAVD